MRSSRSSRSSSTRARREIFTAAGAGDGDGAGHRKSAAVDVRDRQEQEEDPQPPEQQQGSWSLHPHPRKTRTNTTPGSTTAPLSEAVLPFSAENSGAFDWIWDRLRRPLLSPRAQFRGRRPHGLSLGPGRMRRLRPISHGRGPRRDLWPSGCSPHSDIKACPCMRTSGLPGRLVGGSLGIQGLGASFPDLERPVAPRLQRTWLNVRWFSLKLTLSKHQVLSTRPLHIYCSPSLKLQFPPQRNSGMPIRVFPAVALETERQTDNRHIQTERHR